VPRLIQRHHSASSRFPFSAQSLNPRGLSCSGPSLPTVLCWQSCPPSNSHLIPLPGNYIPKLSDVLSRRGHLMPKLTARAIRIHKLTRSGRRNSTLQVRTIRSDPDSSIDSHQASPDLMTPVIYLSSNVQTAIRSPPISLSNPRN
jgi:hypothetical protein